MKLAGSFEAAVGVAEQNCSEWIFMGSGEVTRVNELHEVAREFDAKMPLADDEFLAVTDDGSIGLLFPGCKEPDWYYVSAPFAVVNILHDDIHKYIIPIDGDEKMADGSYGAAVGTAAAGAAETGTVFCKNCGAELKPGSKFCEHCGAKNAPQFCTNCGEKLEPGSAFCGNCGAKVQ